MCCLDKNILTNSLSSFDIKHTKQFIQNIKHFTPKLEVVMDKTNESTEQEW